MYVRVVLNGCFKCTGNCATVTFNENANSEDEKIKSINRMMATKKIVQLMDDDVQEKPTTNSEGGIGKYEDEKKNNSKNPKPTESQTSCFLTDKERKKKQME
ncbi:hypothetical protein D917_09912 [Trichinella nativa]|uniref:Uncharacterized protein n=1 Tax=Trichinella nativa TaxID=6335 RepID=A0A1Y3EDJ1_9BILA|nr:hypothetical protein D917_09912 [Trichinella nativa]